MQFDNFYQTIGTFGRYQKVKYFLICLTYMLPPIMVYTWTFTAATPSFQCGLPNDDLSDNRIDYHTPSESQCREYKKQISIHECQRCYLSTNKSYMYDENNGALQACTSFIFDRTYYQSTLVEEVSSLFFSSIKTIKKILFLVVNGL